MRIGARLRIYQGTDAGNPRHVTIEILARPIAATLDGTVDWISGAIEIELYRLNADNVFADQSFFRGTLRELLELIDRGDS